MPANSARHADWFPYKEVKCAENNQKVYSTVYSQAVTHPSTNTAQPCLTSVIRYGRRQGPVVNIGQATIVIIFLKVII